MLGSYGIYLFGGVRRNTGGEYDGCLASSILVVLVLVWTSPWNGLVIFTSDVFESVLSKIRLSATNGLFGSGTFLRFWIMRDLGG